MEIQILYNEAIRQRAERASLFASVMNKGWQSEDDQRKLNKSLDQLKNPYGTKPDSDSGGDWNLMRAKQKVK